MTKEFVTYEQALELKQLGFNDQCIASYNYEDLDIREFIGNEECLLLAPTFSQAFRWFRDKYNFHHFIEPIHMDGKVRYEYCVVNSSSDDKEFNEDVTRTYEDAEIECLNQFINLIKNK